MKTRKTRKNSKARKAREAQSTQARTKTHTDTKARTHVRHVNT